MVDKSLAQSSVMPFSSNSLKHSEYENGSCPKSSFGYVQADSTKGFCENRLVTNGIFLAQREAVNWEIKKPIRHHIWS
jgi:hypothetical protein